MNPRLETAARAAPAIALVMLVILAAFLTARWTMYWLTPAEPPAIRANERLALGAVAQIVADARLFGSARVGEVATNLNIKLKGVFADEGAPSGWAILNTGGKDETARAGREIAPGVVLDSVHVRHVVLRRDGVLERVNLEERTVASTAALPRYTPPPTPTPVATPTPSMVAPTPAPGTPNPLHQRYRRGEPMAPVADQPTDAPPAASTQPAGVPGTSQLAGSSQGLVVQAVAPGSMLERLGLQPGDVVRSVNGEQVRSEADVARIIQSRGLQGSYSAEVQRGGQTIALAVNAPR
jgi:general secretion pathway protein C